MEKTYHSLKDFELSYGKNAIVISDVKAIG